MTVPDDRLSTEQVLFLIDLWRMDIEAEPFAHEDMWAELVAPPREEAKP